MLKKISIFTCIAIASLTVMSCGGGKVFEMVQEDTFLKPGTIAVICGTNKDQDYVLAKSITENLQKETGYKVMTQEEIAGKIPDYSYKDIIGEWGNPPGGTDNRAWFSPENIAAVNAVHKYLKTEYIYVVWTGEMNVVMTRNQYGGGSTSYSIAVYGRLLKYPEGQVTGYTVDMFDKSSCCELPFRTHNQEITDLLKSTGRDIALEIDDFTKNEKGGR